MRTLRVVAAALAVTGGAVCALGPSIERAAAQGSADQLSVQRSFAAPWLRTWIEVRPADPPQQLLAPQNEEKSSQNGQEAPANSPAPAPSAVATPPHTANPSLAAPVAAPPARSAKQDQPAPSARAVVAPTPSAPASQAAPKVDAPKVDAWSPAEIEMAKARCNVLLKGIDAVVIPQDSIKKGACGAPAPVQLVSIGKNPAVAFSPPPTLTCDMVAALAEWLKDGIQPAAKRHLGSPIIRVDVMSDYSCRGVYGRLRARLSEHGRANALDVRGFLTADAREATVLADWGPTVRDIQIAAAKAEAERVAAAKAAAAAKGQPAPSAGAATASAEPSPAATASAIGALRPAIGVAVQGAPSVRLPGVRPAEAGTGLGLSSTVRQIAQPNYLGGPKAQRQAAAKSVVVTDPAVLAQRRSLFIRDVHAAACRIFSTTLGPEADIYHRNHFHVDMAQRQSGRFCS